MDLCSLFAAVLTLLSAIIVSAYPENLIPSEDSYVAAVVEYNPVGNPETETAEDVLCANVANYETFVEDASKLGADIVVFPEYGLTQTWPSNERDQMIKYAQAVPPIASMYNEVAIVPCLSQNVSWVVKRISCSARANHIYVVINLPEAVTCNLQDEECPNDGIFIYNSNVAFDRYGAVISKYHKYNLFLEPALNKPKKVHHSFFTSDFNVTFGMFICFDILFKEPAFNLAKIENITDMIFPTAWFSELPFLTAIQTQASWSLGVGVNLLASGYNNPKVGSGGSGIYSGIKGSLVTYMPSNTGSVLMVANVPKISTKCSENDIYCREAHFQTTTQTFARSTQIKLLHEDLSQYNYSTIVRDGMNETTVCHGNFCCQFYADIDLGNDTSKNSTYRFAVYEGNRTYASGAYQSGLQVCAILHCLGDDSTKCGYPPEESSNHEPIIRSLRISGNFTSSQMTLPNTVNFELKPFPPHLFDFTKDNEGIQFSSKGHLKGVLSISIYGRNFQSDSK